MPNTKEVEQAAYDYAREQFGIPGPHTTNMQNFDLANDSFIAGAEYALSNPLEQSENKEEWVSVDKYNQLKDSFEELLYATVMMLYSGNHDKSAEITKDIWREKAGVKDPKNLV